MALMKKRRDFLKHTREEFFEGGKEEVAKKLMTLGIDDETIIKATGFTSEQIQALHKAVIKEQRYGINKETA